MPLALLLGNTLAEERITEVLPPPSRARTNPFVSTFQLMVHNAGLHTDKCTRTRARCGASIVRQRVAAFA